jgi:hypothetical protein
MYSAHPTYDFSLSAVHLSVSGDMAKDIKEINFGYNNDPSYDTNHRGLSPFFIIGIFMATASRRQAEQYSRTSNHTLSEVAMADTTPDPRPTEYYGTANLSRRYVGLLQHTIGNQCEHHTKVWRITAELTRRPDMFENLKSQANCVPTMACYSRYSWMPPILLSRHRWMCEATYLSSLFCTTYN